jgi:hypothetical protein
MATRGKVRPEEQTGDTQAKRRMKEFDPKQGNALIPSGV